MVPLLEEEEIDFSNNNQDTGDSEEGKDFGLSKEAVSACQGEIQIMDIQSSQMAISITGLVLNSSSWMILCHIFTYFMFLQFVL